MINAIKGLFMAKKKTTPARATVAKKKDVAITKESLLKDGYIHLKDKGDASIYAKNGRRVSIAK